MRHFFIARRIPLFSGYLCLRTCYCPRVNRGRVIAKPDLVFVEIQNIFSKFVYHPFDSKYRITEPALLNGKTNSGTGA